LFFTHNPSEPKIELPSDRSIKGAVWIHLWAQAAGTMIGKKRKTLISLSRIPG